MGEAYLKNDLFYAKRDRCSGPMRAKQMYCEPLNSNNGWSTSKVIPQKSGLVKGLYIIHLVSLDKAL